MMINKNYRNLPYVRRTPRISRMIGKTVVAIVLGMILMGIAGSMMMDAEYAYFDNDEGMKVGWCDNYYYTRNYAGLLNQLQLDGLYGETYDIYWEAVDGYNDYLEFVQWTRVEPESMPEAADFREMARQKVLDNAANCRNEKNRERLNEWADVVR